MFTRKVATCHRSSGGSYSSFRLLRNVRSDSGTRQIHLLNLGADFDVPPQRWPELVQLILDCDSSQLSLKPPDPQLLALAQRIHRCLLERSALHPGDGLASVRLDSLVHSHVRSVGAERLALHALDQLAFRDALEAVGTSPRDARVAAALVLARRLQPSSERAACNWLNSRSATLELLGLECARPLSLNKLYRTADILWRHRDALEGARCRRERALFETTSTLVFIDLTNVHYHGRAGGDLQFGRSQQRRNDCPLVTLGLSLDESGFPLRSEVLPGNISEPGTLAAADGDHGRRAVDRGEHRLAARARLRLDHGAARPRGPGCRLPAERQHRRRDEMMMTNLPVDRRVPLDGGPPSWSP